MDTEVAITPRNLGCICLDSYCPACLFYLVRMKFHPPFNHFGAGIFNAMQRIEEAIVGDHLDKNGCLPKAFAPFCDCSARVDFPNHWSKFKYVHKTGVTFYGEPDEIFELKDGTLCVIDHKTARNKGDADPFHGQYVAQVVGYGNIAEVGLDLGTVSRGGLFYWEIQDQQVQDDPAGHYSHGEVLVPFVPSTVEIEIDYSILDPLIKELKKVWNASAPPEGRDGCMDCKRLQLLLGIEREIELKDEQLLRTFGDILAVRDEVTNHIYERSKRYSALLTELRESGEQMFEYDGIAAHWEFLNSEAPEL